MNLDEAVRWIRARGDRWLCRSTEEREIGDGDEFPIGIATLASRMMSATGHSARRLGELDRAADDAGRGDRPADRVGDQHQQQVRRHVTDEPDQPERPDLCRPARAAAGERAAAARSAACRRPRPCRRSGSRRGPRRGRSGRSLDHARLASPASRQTVHWARGGRSRRPRAAPVPARAPEGGPSPIEAMPAILTSATTTPTTKTSSTRPELGDQAEARCAPGAGRSRAQRQHGIDERRRPASGSR